jgi:4-amino-4-deoxychorismate lyase
MSRLIESIRLLDGEFFNLPYHQQRMKRSIDLLYGIDYSFDIEKYLEGVRHPRKGLYKCRIVYDDVTMEAGFSAYEPRKIRRIKIVEDNDISYACKFLDRHDIDRLFQQRGDCDDVLIVKEDRITDCSFSNIVFRKRHQWVTPSTPLLAGTMRQKLIDENKIEVREIRPNDIRSFETFTIINAMLEFSSPEIEVSEIVF